MRNLVGETELIEFIKEQNSNPSIYTPSIENIEQGKYRATLHMHTINSDGKMTVKEVLDRAQKYAQKYIPDNGYMYIAITDHNTVWGAKEVVQVLERNPFKYNRIKVIPGIEIFTKYNNSEVASHPIEIHVLTWCINPYNPYLTNEFWKNSYENKWNRNYPDRDFDWTIKTMSEYGIVGIAHPARYNVWLKEKKYAYITEMLTRYKSLTNKLAFVEGYYQSYHKLPEKDELALEYDEYLKYIIEEANRLGIYNTGSVDAHHHSIFYQ
ncbi:hypothetical protein IJ182_11245 [bacterium]|nr:hypothetical protein [bacterium]